MSGRPVATLDWANHCNTRMCVPAGSVGQISTGQMPLAMGHHQIPESQGWLSRQQGSSRWLQWVLGQLQTSVRCCITASEHPHSAKPVLMSVLSGISSISCKFTPQGSFDTTLSHKKLQTRLETKLGFCPIEQQSKVLVPLFRSN